MLLQLHCEVCRYVIPSSSETALCTKESCIKIHKMRTDLKQRIVEYVEHFKGRIPDEYTYREYLEKAGLENKYKAFAGILEDDYKQPKCSRRVWFQTNIASVHQAWPDESGRLKNDIED